MSHALVIATRELRERSRLFLMCAAMALLPFLISLVPAAKNDRSMVIATTGGALAAIMAVGTAIALGTSTIGGDLAARRLSFYFAKPISPAALWSGKVMSALLTSAVCYAIIAVPSVLVTQQKWLQTWTDPGQLLALLAGIVVALFFTSHVLGTMVRSKSALIGIDFALAFGAGFALFFIIRPLLLASVDLLKGVLAALAAAVLLIVAIAPVWQLANGRTDVRRSHAALSRALWVSMAVLVVVAAAFMWWIVSVAPSDVTHVNDLEQAPGSNHFVLTGANKYRGDYQATFLVNADTGRYTRLDSPVWWNVRYSSDGRVAAWMRPYTMMPSHRLELHTRRLDDPNAKNVATGIRLTGFPMFTLSDDGARIAIADNAVVTVYEVATQRLLASVRLPFGRTDLRGLFFISPDIVRLTEYKSVRSDVPVRIYDLITSGKKIEQVGAMHAQMGHGAIAASQDGSRLLFRHANAIGDGRTGAFIAELPVQAVRPFAMAMLNDGRVAAMAKAGKGLRLHLLTRDGQPIREMELPVERAMITAQIGDDKLLINSSVGGARRQWDVLVVDLSRGVVERRIENVRGPMPTWHDPRLTRFEPDQKVAGVEGESSGEGRVVVIDLRTGGHSPLPRS
ncbi:MAG TPA: hypothetical protein VNA69_09445 [Thermoanaerobaculia bacterium]|nr:hypothetical protein [Thermoanaerobaculia bacterium]